VLTRLVGVTGEAPPDVYPDTVDDCPATSSLACVRSPTSLALVSTANGNLSITLDNVGPGAIPPDVYPDTDDDCPAAARLVCDRSPTSVALPYLSSSQM